MRGQESAGGSARQGCEKGYADLAMREPMEEAALLDVLDLQDHITIASPTCGRHNVLVEGKGDEDDDDEQVDDGADSTHALRKLFFVVFAHVDAFQASLDEGRTEPSNHGIAGAEGYAAEC